MLPSIICEGKTVTEFEPDFFIVNVGTEGIIIGGSRLQSRLDVQHHEAVRVPCGESGTGGEYPDGETVFAQALEETYVCAFC